MPPGVFRHNDQYKDAHERLFSDVEVYRALGSTAEKAIRFGEAVIEPREYQEEAWSSIGRARAEGRDSALVHLATGLGKTTVAVVDALNFAVDFYEREGRMPKMMFAVHQTEILEQAALRFKEFAPSLSQGSFVGDEKDTDSLLTLATMQSLSRNLENLDPEEFDYIAYDEAHHAQAQTYRKVVEHFNPSFKLALTATPDRMDEEDIRELFGKEVYSKTLAEAMSEGLLVDVDYHIVFDEAVKRAIEEGFTPETLSEIRELLKNTARNEEIAEQIKDQMDQIGLEEAKTIVFCDSISQANEMATLLGGKAYHSEAEDLEDTMDGFRNGSQQIITTCDMFNEGVDVPDTRLVVFLRATGSRTIFEQQLGRGMRKHPGKNVLSVLDFVGNIERLSQIKELVDAITEAGMREGDEANDDTQIDDSSTDRIMIRSLHTAFDFNKLAVDLLEKYGQLKLNFEQAPEDWSSISDIADIIGTLKQTVFNAAKALELEGEMMIGSNGRAGRHYTPDQVRQIIEKHEGTASAPEDWQTATGIGKAGSRKASDIRTAATQLGIIGIEMRSQAGRIGIHYTPEESTQILNHLAKSLERQDEWNNINNLSETLPISRPTIQSMIKEMQIEPEMMKGPTGKLTPHYPPGTAHAILEEYNKIPAAPEGWASGASIRKELGVNGRRLTTAIEKIEASGSTYRASNGKPSLFFSPDEVERIKRQIQLDL